MTLALTPDQAAQLTPHMRPGTALIGRVHREPFDGGNAATCGTLTMELGTVPESALPKLDSASRPARFRWLLTPTPATLEPL